MVYYIIADFEYENAEVFCFARFAALVELYEYLYISTKCFALLGFYVLSLLPSLHFNLGI